MEYFCKVCNSKLEEKYGECDYCGYSNHPILTIDADDFSQYKNEVVMNLNNIVILVDVYKKDDAKHTWVNVSKKSIAFGSGEDLLNSTVWSSGEDWIAHPQDETETGQLKITYEYKGKKKETKATIPLKAQEGVWYIGLKLDNNLHLSAFVGEEGNYAGETHNIALELVDHE